jgi:hypothetical protein
MFLRHVHVTCIERFTSVHVAFVPHPVAFSSAHVAGTRKKSLVPGQLASSDASGDASGGGTCVLQPRRPANIQERRTMKA